MSRASRVVASDIIGSDMEGSDVKLIDNKKHIILDNGILQVTLSNPEGHVVGIRFGGLDNLLETSNKEKNRGYWDLDWNKPGEADTYDNVEATEYHIVDQTPDKIEVSFVRNYTSSKNMVPLNIDKRFILLRGNYGFYSYAIYDHVTGWEDFNLNQTRIAFKLQKDRFRYMAIADDKQRIMPFPEDRYPQNCEKLAYPEAVILTHPKDPELQGEVDDKYLYSSNNWENKVHGWISFDPMIGFWIIMPSNEFRNGGPLKQNLTSHVGPTSLAMFHSAHYAGQVIIPKFRDGEPWKKVFGPVLVYLNAAAPGTPVSLWEDAKEQMLYEVQSWPYHWPSSEDYLKSDERGAVSGRLFVLDRFSSPEVFPAASAFLGLALPGEKGSWQIESKGYQFWTQADDDGYFQISNIRAGDYELYGWVNGVFGDYKNEGIITIQSGSSIDLGDLTFEAPKDGNTVWEIGLPNRSAIGFFVPDPDPKYVNKLFLDHPERYRQYGLWLRYSEIFPENDLVYSIGVSDWTKDWFFAHVARIKKDGSLVPTTWQVRFQLDSIAQSGSYKLRLAFASANFAAIQVRFNDPNIDVPHYDTMQFGMDNAIARHGIHGLYHSFDIDVSPKWLQQGQNIMYLTQRKTPNIFVGVMYDYLRLEEPTASS